MQLKIYSIITLICFLNSCSANKPDSTNAIDKTNSPISNNQTDTTIAINHVKDISLPDGYKRVKAHDNSFGNWLQNVKISSDNTVYYYDGTKKPDQSSHLCVLDIDVGKKDLQQCADAVMRLRAEYYWQSNQKNKIEFHFTSGHLVKWSDYAKGMRPKISGSKVTFHKTANENHSYANFKKYLTLIFSYCGTYSLNKELKKVANEQDVQIGDVWIQTGNPYGHAVIVMDLAKNAKGEKIYLLAQSYMPAQSIHILLDPKQNYKTAWYKVDNAESRATPHWTFYKGEFKRF